MKPSHSYYGSRPALYRSDGRLNPGARGFIASQFRAEMRVIDIGCGSGATLLENGHRFASALGGAEGWSSPGRKIQPIDQDGIKVGILICADAYQNEVAGCLKERGAQVLVSPSAWGPGECGPDGEWERRSGDTGLPIMVCNRTGVEPDELDYRRAESVVAKDGQRLLAAYSDRPVILSFDWDMDEMALLSQDFQRTYL